MWDTWMETWYDDIVMTVSVKFSMSCGSRQVTVVSWQLAREFEGANVASVPVVPAGKITSSCHRPPCNKAAEKRAHTQPQPIQLLGLFASTRTYVENCWGFQARSVAALTHTHVIKETSPEKKARLNIQHKFYRHLVVPWGVEGRPKEIDPVISLSRWHQVLRRRPLSLLLCLWPSSQHWTGNHISHDVFFCFAANKETQTVFGCVRVCQHVSLNRRCVN